MQKSYKDAQHKNVIHVDFKSQPDTGIVRVDFVAGRRISETTGDRLARRLGLFLRSQGCDTSSRSPRRHNLQRIK